MAAGTADDAKKMEELLKNGLRANHAYSILSTHTYNIGQGKAERVIKIRNPHGKEEWAGANKYRTDAAMKQLGVTESGTGVFFMQLEDYINMFTTTNICKYNDTDVHSYSISNTDDVKELNFFTIDIDNKFIQSNPEGLEIMVN